MCRQRKSESTKISTAHISITTPVYAQGRRILIILIILIIFIIGSSENVATLPSKTKSYFFSNALLLLISTCLSYLNLREAVPQIRVGAESVHEVCKIVRHSC